MGIRLSDLWGWRGPLGRKPFIVWGVLLFAIKFGLDWTLTRFVFDRPWSIEDYGIAGRALERLLRTPHDRVYHLSLLALGLPFLWAGVVLTLKRIRSAGLPAGLVLLFFVPVLKLLFFVVLALLPETDDAVRAKPITDKRVFSQIVPKQPLGRAAFAIGMTLLYAFCTVWLGTKYLKSYGWVLFVGLPFWMGFSAALMYGYHQPQRWGAYIGIALLTVFCGGVVLLMTAFEGGVCLIMASPIAGVMALVGGVLAHRVQTSRYWPYGSSASAVGLLLILIPVAMKLETFWQAQSPVLNVKSALLINAPPEKVWHHVVSFVDLPKPTEWLFKMGIAYPVRAEIFGHGPDAVRHCTFTTGPFVEPIEVWDEPRLLKFAVTANPPPMREWSPYADIHPPHLEGFLVSRAGQFELSRTTNNQTLLEGTTWYQHHMFPVLYWEVWSDYIIHRIHLRVLKHVKALAENDRLQVARQ